MSENQLYLFQDEIKEKPEEIFKVRIDGFGQFYMDQNTYKFIERLSKKLIQSEKDNKRLEKEVKKLNKELKKINSR